MKTILDYLPFRLPIKDNIELTFFSDYQSKTVLQTGIVSLILPINFLNILSHFPQIQTLSIAVIFKQ